MRTYTANWIIKYLKFCSNINSVEKLMSLVSEFMINEHWGGAEVRKQAKNLPCDFEQFLYLRQNVAKRVKATILISREVSLEQIV